MSSTVAVLAIIAVFAVIGYLVVMRVFFRESKELDRKIDFGKMKPWKDDED